MTTYQIITIVIALITLSGSGIAVYMRLKTNLGILRTKVSDLRIDTDSKANLELVRQGQTETNRQLDQLNKQINLVVTKLMK